MFCEKPGGFPRRSVFDRALRSHAAAVRKYRCVSCQPDSYLIAMTKVVGLLSSRAWYAALVESVDSGGSVWASVVEVAELSEGEFGPSEAVVNNDVIASHETRRKLMFRLAATVLTAEVDECSMLRSVDTGT